MVTTTTNQVYCPNWRKWNTKLWLGYMSHFIQEPQTSSWLLFYCHVAFKFFAYWAMSVPSPGSPANNRSAESLYHDAVASGDRQFTTPSPSARQDDSHDDSDYRDTPNRQSSQSGTVWTTPSHRSITASISASLRTSLNDLYGTLYGQDSIRCLLTQGQGGLNVAHVIRHASKPCEVSRVHNLRIITYG